MIDVPRTNARAFEEPPLSWKPIQAHGSRSAIFKCPNGHMGSLHEWTIADDGTVTPSVDCSPNGCDFHDHIRLLGWSLSPDDYSELEALCREAWGDEGLARVLAA